MIKKVKEAIKKYRMLEPGDSVVVAVSGGPDSIALLKILETLSDEYGLTLITAHLNHGLREGADREAKFVCEISKEMGIKFECKTVDMNFLRKGTGKSIEDISRDVRYQFLNDVAKRHRAHKIALGHHLNDQVETVLINFLRGSGPEGLKGMLPARDSTYIRPLLNVSRKEILSFLDIHKIPFISDESNTEDIYLRNRIRHLLIPELTASYNPKLEESLSKMAEIMRVEDDFMKTVSDKILSEWGARPDDNNEIRIKISELRMYHEAVQRRIIKNILQRSTPNSQGIGYAHIQGVKDLAYSDHPSGHLNLPYHTLVRREYDFLVISKVGKFDRNFIKERDQVFYKVTLPGSLNIAESGKTIIFDFVEPPVQTKSNRQDIVFMDYDKIILPLVIRTGKPGDRIQPLGMKGTKKIKSYFIDKKVPLNFRKDVLLLLDQESVLWIAGMRMSERVKITEKTRRILKAEIV